MAFRQTILTIIQNAAAEMGFGVPSVVVGSTDQQTQQFLALAKRELRELQQNYDWTMLQAEYDLSVNPPTQTVGDLVQGSYAIRNIPTDALISPVTYVVQGSYVPVNTRALVVGSTIVRMSQPATGTQAGAPLTFAQDTYPEPEDFDRFINDTWWDRTNRWKLLGPDTPQIDQWQRSGVVPLGPRRHFRQIGAFANQQLPTGGDFGPDFGPDFSLGTNNARLNYNYRIWPPPAATDTPLNLVFEYMSKNAVFSANGVWQSDFLADTDTCVIDGNAITMGLKWRFFQIKGWDYAALQAEYVDYCSRLYANDGGNRTLNMAARRTSMFISPANVQDGNFPGGG